MHIYYNTVVLAFIFFIYNSFAISLLSRPTNRPSNNVRRSGGSVLNLATENSTVSTPGKDIRCYEAVPNRPRTSIDGCRPTLNYIKTFPNYRKQQAFLEDWWPKEPSLPPYAVHHEASNCAVKISSFDARKPDRFSFADVRTLATQILEDCEAGYGGIGIVGTTRMWTVAVIGISNVPPSTDPLNFTAIADAW